MTKDIQMLRNGVLFSLLFNSYLGLCTDSQFDKISSVGEHLLKRESPDRVLLIFDVDGTLTSESTPKSEIHAVERRHAREVIHRLQSVGFLIVYSSAWNHFDGTLRRIGSLGLVDSEGLSKEIMTGQHTFVTTSGEEVPVNFKRAGNVISVQDPKIDPTYFRQKALAPLLHPEIARRLTDGEIKEIVFIDDSPGNHRHFKSDVSRFGLYSEIGIENIFLGRPDGEYKRAVLKREPLPNAQDVPKAQPRRSLRAFFGSLFPKIKW